MTFKQIYKSLDEYFELSESMVGWGFSWGVIISLHEVFRHLYPTEPYITAYKVRDEEKPEFILRLLSSQVSFYRVVAQGVTPYEIVQVSGSGERIEDIEVETGNLYSDFWRKLPMKAMVTEARGLIEKRIGMVDFQGKTALDLGCGSGRYTIALALLGCKSVIGYDIGDASLSVGRTTAKEYGLENVRFTRGNVLGITQEDNSFDFVFCSGVLHHTRDTKRGLAELYRILGKGGSAYLYLYATGGLFWDFRRRAREITGKIPYRYAEQIMGILRVPRNRFFLDTWYVPIEKHTSRKELENLLDSVGFTSFEKVISKNEADLDNYIGAGKPYAKELYGEGEHRYLLHK